MSVTITEQPTQVTVTDEGVQVATIALQGPPGTGLNPLIQGYREVLVDHGGIDGLVTISFRAANQHLLALDGDAEIAFADWPAAPGQAGKVTLWIVQDGSSAYEVSWPPEVDWGAADPPSLILGRMACITLFSLDGGATVQGFYSGAGFGPVSP